MIDVLNTLLTDKRTVESNGQPRHRYMLRERKPKPIVVVIPLGKPVPRRKRTAKKIQVKAELSLTKRSGRSVLKQKTWQAKIKASSARRTGNEMSQRKSARIVPRRSIYIKSEKMTPKKVQKSVKTQTKEKLKSFKAMKSVRMLSTKRLMAKSAKVSSSTAKAAIESPSSRYGQSSRCSDRRPTRGSKSEMLLAEAGDTSVFDGRTGRVFEALTNDLPKPSYVEVIDMEP